jgi:hypothetical protein
MSKISNKSNLSSSSNWSNLKAMRLGAGQLYLSCGAFAGTCAIRAQQGIARFVREEKGDLVSSLGWMAIIALLLVMIKGVVDGRLTGYVNSIFSHLDRVFNAGS